MIAMSMTSVYDEYRRSRIAAVPAYPISAHPVRRAMARVLSRIGIGRGNCTTMDDDELLGIG